MSKREKPESDVTRDEKAAPEQLKLTIRRLRRGLHTDIRAGESEDTLCWGGTGTAWTAGHSGFY